MTLLGSVEVAPHPVARLEPVIGGERYARMLAANAVELLGKIRPGDQVLLHNPHGGGQPDGACCSEPYR